MDLQSYKLIRKKISFLKEKANYWRKWLKILLLFLKYKYTYFKTTFK
jgi:hypothetical protein